MLFRSVYDYDFTKVENSVSLTASVQDLSDSISGITVTPAQAATLTVAAVAAKKAGESFTTTVSVKDVFDNPTGVGCSNLTISGGSNSPGGHGSSITSPTFPAPAGQSGTGLYTTGSITLYNSGTETLNFSACSLNESLNVSVSHGDADSIYLSTTNSAPAVKDLATDIEAGELLCANSGSGLDVSCSPIYAFFWDQYGNPTNSDLSCDSWSYSNISGASSPSVSGAGHSLTLSHNDYLDGTLTCTKNGKTASVLTYGGLSRVELISDYSGPIIAGIANLDLTNIKLFYQKNNSEQVKTDAGSLDISFATTSILGFGGSGIRAQNSATCNFTAAGECTTGYAFNFTKTESNVNLSATVRGLSASLGAITVNPATAATLTVAPIGTQTSGQAFATTVSIVDAFNNPTGLGCGNLVVTGGNTSPGGHGGTATAALLPSSASQGSVGQYQSGNIKLFNSGSEVLNFAACSLSENVNVTVEAAGLANIYLAASDSIPTNNTTAFNCTAGFTVNCPEIFAFGWDAYGNNIDGNSFACGSWSFSDHTSNDPDPSLSFNSGHSTTASANVWHIDGEITCAVGAVTASADLDGVIEKSFSWSCGNWSCSAGEPTAACTISNSSGYDISSFVFSGENAGTSLDTTNCDSGLSSGGNCVVTVTGDVGNASGNLAVTASGDPSVQFINPSSSAVANSVLAPNCSDQLTVTDNGWTCVAGGTAEWSLSLQNDNDYEQAIFGSNNPVFDLANGAVLDSTACINSSLDTGNICTSTVHQSTFGVSSTIRFEPTDSYFQDALISSTNSPNCSNSLSYTDQVVGAFNCIDNGSGGKTKRIQFTIANDNDQEIASLGTATSNGSSVISNSCDNQDLNPGDSCVIVIEWFAAPLGAPSDTNFGLPTGVGDYFNDLQIQSGDVDNSCPL